jgi:flagellar protein FliJ
MAKKFTYSLETILKIRSHLAKEAKEELMYIVGLRRQKENEIDNKKNYLHELSRTQFISSKARYLQTQIYHRISIGEEIKTLEKQKRQIMELEAVKLKKYNEALKEEKILDKLKEKQFNNYLSETLKEEVKILDELSITRYKSSYEL